MPRPWAATAAREVASPLSATWAQDRCQRQGHIQGLTLSLPLPDAASSVSSLDLALTGLQLASC